MSNGETPVDPVLQRKLAAVGAINKRVNDDQKKKGLPPVARMATEVLAAERIPTGSPSLDIQLVGGWPKGAWVEIFGPESSGKSTLAYQTIAELHRRDPNAIALLIDLETSFDEARGARMGIDKGRLVYLQPTGAEDVFKTIEQFVDAIDEQGRSIISLVVLDSIAVLETAADGEAEFDEATVGTLARLLSRVYRRLQGKLFRTGTTILAINQTREKIGGYGDTETTPGGKAPKFYSAVRVRTSKVKDITASAKPIGQTSRVKVRKNKAGGGKDDFEISILFSRGIDAGVDIVRLGVKLGVIAKAGGNHGVTMPDGSDVRERSEADLLRRLRTDEAVFAYLYDRVVAAGIAVLRAEVYDEDPVDESELDPEALEAVLVESGPGARDEAPAAA